MFQAFEPIKVIGDGPDAGRAGTYRGKLPEHVMQDEETGEHQTIPAQDPPPGQVVVQLDGDDAPKLLPADDVVALGF